MASTKYPVLRQTLIIFSFLSIIGLFFALNHFILIPQQQQSYNNKIFRALQAVSADFEKTLDGQADYFAKNRNRTSPNQEEIFLNKNGSVKQRIIDSFKKLNQTIVTTKYKRRYDFQTDTVSLLLLEDSIQKFDTALAIRGVLEPTIQHLHKDLFDLVMLVSRDTVFIVDKEKKTRQIHDRLLYKYGDLATGYILPGDSLFNSPRFGQFSSIGDISIAGTSYKAFTLPFRFEGNELMLTGFLKEKTYKVTTTGYSKLTLLWIVLLLTIFTLSLPLIKIYLSSRQERINTNDLRMLMVVFIAAPFLATLIAVTLLIYRQSDKKTNTDLAMLHREVGRNFKNEIDSVIQQLKHYDSLLTLDDNTLNSVYNSRKSLLEGKSDTSDFMNTLFYPTIYKNLDDIFWVNKYGRQIAKWFFINERVSYLDISSRNYFKRIQDMNIFFSGKDAFYIEPTISWATGNYSVNILLPSDQDFLHNTQKDDSSKAIMIGLAARMYSVCNPVLPKGYNFCIINEQGEILFHSQTERSLHENLFDESDGNAELINAVQRKDNTLISDAQLFDKTVKMQISPVQGMPSFHLVSYLNKREQNLFVFHIAAFTLLCTTLALFSLLFLVMLYYFFGRSVSRRRHYTYQSAWMKPSEKKKTFYQQNITQQICTVLLSFIFLLLVFISKENQYWYLLQCSILLPLFVSTGYFLLRNEYNATPNQSTSLKNRKSFASFLKRNGRMLFVYWLTILFIFFSLSIFQGKTPLVSTLSIALLSLSVPLIAWNIHFFQKKATRFYPSNYISNYTGLIFLCTFFISVLPALGICSFAMNEEKQMQAKASQFDVAIRIESRRATLNNYFKTTRLGHHETDYIRTRKLSEGAGIYLLSDMLDTTINKEKNAVKTILHSPFYEVVTHFLFLPKDHSEFFTDNASYFWYQDTLDRIKYLNFVYKNETDPVTKNDVTIRHQQQKSNLLYSMFADYGGWLIFLSVAAFFISHFILIQAISKRIFLLDYFTHDAADEPDHSWVNQFYNIPSLAAADKTFLKMDNNDLTNKVINEKEEEITGNKEEEEKLLNIQYLLKPAYDTIWTKLTSEEQFVLYDFALDGFTNYRNIDILYGLYKKGLIRKKDQQLELMNYSFRSYLLGKTGTEEIINLEKELNFGSSWKNLKNIFFILFFAILIFIFATQQDVSNRILAIVSGLATLVPFLLKVFDRNITGSGAKQGG